MCVLMEAVYISKLTPSNEIEDYMALFEVLKEALKKEKKYELDKRSETLYL